MRSSSPCIGSLRCFAWACVAGLLFLAGCLAHDASGGRDADSSITGTRVTLRDVKTSLVDIESRLKAGNDINQNDNWTFRLLGLGVLLLGLSYPVGKIVWLASAAISRKASPFRLIGRGTDDYIAFRQKSAALVDATLPA